MVLWISTPLVTKWIPLLVTMMNWLLIWPWLIRDHKWTSQTLLKPPAIWKGVIVQISRAVVQPFLIIWKRVMILTFRSFVEWIGKSSNISKLTKRWKDSNKFMGSKMILQSGETLLSRKRVNFRALENNYTKKMQSPKQTGPLILEIALRDFQIWTLVSLVKSLPQ
jgi:hypothetical protein